MPTSANITTAGDIAFTLPVGTWGVRVINESDTLIRRLLGQPATTSGASLGLPLAAGAGETLVFKQPLKQAVAYCAIHAGTGDKTLTYEIITQPTQGGTGPSSSAASGASNALLLAGASASTLGSLTAATAATGGLLYGTQGGADRKFTLTGAGAAMIEAADAAAQITLLGLGTMSTQAASAVAITGGTATGLTGLGLRSTGAAFDLTLASSEVLTAGRTLSFNVGDADRTLTIPATGTAALLGVAQTFTAANIFSANGAASTPALTLNGTVFTGGTGTSTKPLFLIEPAGTTASTDWPTVGTAYGANLPTGFAGAFAHFQVAGDRMIDLGTDGSIGKLTLYGYGQNLTFYDSDHTTVLGYFSAGRWFAADFTINNTQTINIGQSETVTLANQVQLRWVTGANFYTGTPDIGLIRGGAGILKVTNGDTGSGTLDASAYKAGGVSGIDFSGAVTSITVVKGIITAAS